MSNFKEVPPSEILKQLDIFSSNLTPKSLDIQKSLRESISIALKKCPFSRDHIASHISELVGYKISRSMIDNYADESHLKHRFPAEIISAFCVVVKDYTPLRILVETAGAFLLEPHEAAIAKLLQIRKEREQLVREENEIQERLKHV